MMVTHTAHKLIPAHAQTLNGHLTIQPLWTCHALDTIHICWHVITDAGLLDGSSSTIESLRKDAHELR